MNEVPSQQPLVEVRDVHFAFGPRRIYSGLDLTVPRGAVVTILGPSGCGKSTLLNFLGGRLKPRAGQVRVDGLSVPELRRRGLYALRRRIGMLFQHSALLTDMSVFDNVAFPIREHTALPECMVRDLVLMKLEMVGLRGARGLMPAQLSGGMARRVALARALALDPMLVLYDEPFTGLDPISLGVIVKLIRQLNDALRLTSLIVTHDVAEAKSISDYMYLLGEGRVIASGTPAALDASPDPAVRQFMAGLPDGPVAYHFPAPELGTDFMGSAP